MTDSIFSIEHLNEDNYRFAKMYFEASHDASGLTEYLQKKRFALANEKEDMARTYLVRYSATGQIAAYFTLKNTSIPFLLEKSGAKVLTLYAINSDVVKNFEKWGFVYVDDEAYNQKLTNEYTSYYSKKCNFMYKFINS